MGQKENKILEVFYENPGKNFTIREISSLTKIPRATVHKKVKELREEDFFKDELYFRIKKTNYYVEKLFSCGVVDFLIKELNPSVIILFGGFRKGESDKDSDFDLFVESSSKKNLDLKKFEKKLGHKIDLFVEASLNKLNLNLFNNVVNGIKIYGSFKLK